MVRFTHPTLVVLQTPRGAFCTTTKVGCVKRTICRLGRQSRLLPVFGHDGQECPSYVGWLGLSEANPQWDLQDNHQMVRFTHPTNAFL